MADSQKFSTTNFPISFDKAGAFLITWQFALFANNSFEVLKVFMFHAFLSDLLLLKCRIIPTCHKVAGTAQRLLRMQV